MRVLENQHGVFHQGDWVIFEGAPAWRGETAGVLRHNGHEFYIQTINSGLAGLDKARMETIRKPAANKWDRVVASLPK